MKIAFLTLSTVSLGLFIPAALAAQPGTVRLELKLEANNHVITQPNITVPLGKKSVTEKIMADKSTYIIEVTPQKDIDEQLYLDFTLRKVTNGKSFVISHPRMITLNNQEAIIEEGDSATSDVKNVVLSVTPHL
jgi:type II secretory pathway component GspD/PulD (secretin)